MINLEIANVTLSLNFNYPLTPHDFDRKFSSFLKTRNDSTSIDIDISLDLDKLNLLDTTKPTKIYDGGLSWSMFKNGCNYYMTQNTQSLDDKPLWVASFDHNIKRVTIFFNERAVFKTNDSATVPNLISNPVGQILLMYFLSNNNGALVHAAGLCFRDRGYIFPGKSGAGKSTISRQLTGLDDYEFLSDDRIIVRKIDKTFKAFGTPWPGEAGIAVNKNVTLSGIFFISQANYNKIEEIKPQKAMERLLPVVSIPWYDKEVMIKILDFCEDLISNVPVYELHFKPGNEIINVFQNFVSK